MALARLLKSRIKPIVDLISASTTDTGLKVRCKLATDIYPKGIAVFDEDMPQDTSQLGRMML
jgi:hypothetical protein